MPDQIIKLSKLVKSVKESKGIEKQNDLIADSIDFSEGFYE